MEQDQDFEEMAKRWPDLIQKSKQDYIGVDKGWHNIIEVLFGVFSQDVERAKYQLKFALENPDHQYIKPIPELEASLAKAMEELPTILQIKEKFGSLRVYIGGGTETHYAYISFAAAMASHTCEVCGSPGEPRDGDWVKTLCDKHYQEREDFLDKNHRPKKLKTKVKVSDE